MAESVGHEFDESTAYNAKPGTRLREILDIEESTLGWEPSKITKLSRREFIAQFKAGHEDGSNVNRTGKYFYTTANTNLGAWLVERATNKTTQATVRALLHPIGGENTVYISTDRTGVPTLRPGYDQVFTPHSGCKW